MFGMKAKTHAVVFSIDQVSRYSLNIYFKNDCIPDVIAFF